MRKGQIATFIILGLVLLIISSIFLVVLKLRVSQIPEAKADSSQSINQFIETCLEANTEEAIRTASRSGGYTNLDQFVFPRLEYTGPAALKIPLWLQRDENKKPSVEVMEYELSSFIQNNLQTCLDGLEIYEEQFEIEKQGIEQEDGQIDYSVTTELGSGQANVNLYFPIRIFPLGSNTYVEETNFEIEYDTDMLQKYKIADEIFTKQLETRFLENLTYESLVLSELPTEGMRFDCGSKDIYTYPQAVDLLQNIFKTNLNLLRFKNTNYTDDQTYKLRVNAWDPNKTNTAETIDGQIEITNVDDYYDYYNNFYSFTTSDNDYPSYRVKTIMDKESLVTNDFFADPNKNNFLIEEMDVRNKAPIIGNCIKVAHHFYTFNYNVVFEIGGNDDDIPFRFAVPVRIARNDPKQPASPVYNEVFEDEITKISIADQYCFEKRTIPKKLEVTEINYDLDIPLVSLHDVNISYKCATVTCDIGQIEKAQFGDLNIAEMNFPECGNGEIIFDKDGYLQTRYMTDTLAATSGELDDDFFIQVHMDKLKQLFITNDDRVNFIVVDRNNNKRILKENESIYMTIAERNFGYEQNYFYPFEETQNFIELIDSQSEYVLDIRLMDGDKLIGGYFSNFTYLPDEHGTKDEILFYVFEWDSDLSEANNFAAFWNSQVIPKSSSFQPKYYAR